MKRIILQIIAVISLGTCFFGCSTAEKGSISQYRTPEKEADWIVAGEPIEFEGHLWYARDAVDLLLDSEVSLIGEYRGVQFFVEKIDVRPYDRLYTKFGRNKFRIFTKKNPDDKSQKAH